MQARVQSAALPGISCFAPHMASLTSPVKVWLLPAASAGTAASPINICIPNTAVAIRLTFIVLFSPVKRRDSSGVIVQKWPLDDLTIMMSISRSHYHDSHASFELQKYLLLYTPQFSTLLLLETDLHVHGLVLSIQRFMNAHGPAHGAGKELSCIVHKFLGVIGVVGLTFAQMPRCLHPSLGLCVESYDLQLAHLVEVAFDDVQVVVHGAFLVVEPGVGLDLDRHVAAAAVKLAHIFKVAQKLHRVDGLSKRHVDELRDFADGNCRVAFPVDTGG